MSALGPLRTKATERIFGTGVTGLIAGSLLGWFLDEAFEALGKEGERLDLARLVPGETYLVSTRPPMSRKESKLAARHAAASQELAKMTRPSGSTIRVARRLSRAQRKVERADAGSKRQAKQEAKAERLGARYDAMTKPSPKQSALQAKVDSMAAELEVHRSKAMATTPKRNRPRNQVFR